MRIKYHELYRKCFDDFDSHVRNKIFEKEQIILAEPFQPPFLKHDLQGIRRFKSGKIRISYALSKEKPELWGNEPPEELEIYFLFVGIREDKSYKIAYNLLKKEGIF